MANDKRSKLSRAMEAHGKTMSRNNEPSEEERKFEAIVEKAFKENRIPSECIEEIDIGYATARVVKYVEC